MSESSSQEKFDFYDTKALAKALDVKPEWLRKNRKARQPIPYQTIGRRNIRYTKQAVLEWVGRKDLALKFYSTKTLAEKLSLSESWLHHNRLSENPIPFRRFGYLVRYNETEVSAWLRKNMSNNDLQDEA